MLPWLVPALLLVLTSAQLPPPNRELGFTYSGMPSSKVTLDAYLDLTCPDSAQTFPVLMAVGDAFKADDVRVRMHLFSLPYHRNSHTIAKATHVIAEHHTVSNGTTKSVFAWISAVYKNIDSLATSGTVNMTDLQVLDYLAGMAAPLGIQPADFKKGVMDASVDGAVRQAWKYGCTRGVYGTPLYAVNDVFLQNDVYATWTKDKWVSYLETLV